MKPDNQGYLGSKSAKATGSPKKLDEWSDAEPSNAFNQEMVGLPIKGRTKSQVEMGKKVYDIFPDVGKHRSRTY